MKLPKSAGTHSRTYTFTAVIRSAHSRSPGSQQGHHAQQHQDLLHTVSTTLRILPNTVVYHTHMEGSRRQWTIWALRVPKEHLGTLPSTKNFGRRRPQGCLGLFLPYLGGWDLLTIITDITYILMDIFVSAIIISIYLSQVRTIIVPNWGSLAYPSSGIIIQQLSWGVLPYQLRIGELTWTLEKQSNGHIKPTKTHWFAGRNDRGRSIG